MLLILLVCVSAFDECLKSDRSTPVASEACLNTSFSMFLYLLVLVEFASVSSPFRQVDSE